MKRKWEDSLRLGEGRWERKKNVAPHAGKRDRTRMLRKIVVGRRIRSSLV